MLENENDNTKIPTDKDTWAFESLNWDDINPSESENTNRLGGLIVTTGQDLLNYEIQPEFFIVNPIIPKEAITAITADSGKGKSLLALIMAYQIAKGEKVFGEYEVEKTKVLIIDQEMNKNEIASRFKKITGNTIDDVENIDYIINQDFKIDNPLDFAKLLSLIETNHYGVIMFDTFTEIHSGEENDSGQMKKINAELLELIRETGVSLIYLHHHRKSQRGEKLSQSSSRGSTEIIAKVSSHLLIDSKNVLGENQEKILEITISQEKARSSKRLDCPIKVKIINTEEKIVSEFLGEVEENSKKIDEAKEKILEMLKELPGLKVEEVREKTNIGVSNIRKALDELVDAKTLDFCKQGRAKYYFLATKI